MNYWLEALECSLDEAGCIDALTKEQREKVADDLQRAHEMHAEATGELCIPNPVRSELQETLRKHDRELRERDERERLWKRGMAKALGCPERQLYINRGNIERDSRL
jgi:hypothetical protein